MNNKKDDELSKPLFIVSNAIPPVGFYLYFKYRRQFPNKARKALISAIVGVPIALISGYIMNQHIFN
ncbi:MAG: hypothetical protein J7527_12415 [Chitinophagaceae bacterium]|nr:hypothetical protein [Chitinophagaceae bacterium]